MKTHLRVIDLNDLGQKCMVPIDDEGIAYLNRRKVGDTLECVVVQKRNYAFHSKAMALVRAVYNQLPEPDPIWYDNRIIPNPQRTFEDVRKFLTIAAGYYDVIGLPNGEVRLEAKSWAFDKMTEDEFEVFYDKLIDAALQNLPDDWTAEQLDIVAAEIIGFV